MHVQRWAKKWSLGCENSSLALPGCCLAKQGHFLAHLCISAYRTFLNYSYKDWNCGHSDSLDSGSVHNKHGVQIIAGCKSCLTPIVRRKRPFQPLLKSDFDGSRAPANMTLFTSDLLFFLVPLLILACLKTQQYYRVTHHIVPLVLLT